MICKAKTINCTNFFAKTSIENKESISILKIKLKFIEVALFITSFLDNKKSMA